MFDRSKLESLRDVSIIRIGDTFSHDFPQTVYIKLYIIKLYIIKNHLVHKFVEAVMNSVVNRCKLVNVVMKRDRDYENIQKRGKKPSPISF